MLKPLFLICYYDIYIQVLHLFCTSFLNEIEDRFCESSLYYKKNLW